MKLSRSAGSTSAPHLIILSTSLVHAPLLSRCWLMMRDSWHSVHAVVTLACAGAAGNSGDCARSNRKLPDANSRKVTTANCLLTLHMNFHLVKSVIQIPAGIPLGSLRLSAALAVRSPRQDGIVAALGSFPPEAPQAPRVFGPVPSKLRGLPG